MHTDPTVRAEDPSASGMTISRSRYRNARVCIMTASDQATSIMIILCSRRNTPELNSSNALGVTIDSISLTLLLSGRLMILGLRQVLPV